MLGQSLCLWGQKPKQKLIMKLSTLKALLEKLPTDSTDFEVLIEDREGSVYDLFDPRVATDGDTYPEDWNIPKTFVVLRAI